MLLKQHVDGAIEERPAEELAVIEHGRREESHRRAGAHIHGDEVVRAAYHGEHVVPVAVRRGGPRWLAASVGIANQAQAKWRRPFAGAEDAEARSRAIEHALVVGLD